MFTIGACGVVTDPHLADPPTAAGAVAAIATKSVSAFIATAASSSASFNSSSSSSIYCRAILVFIVASKQLTTTIKRCPFIVIA